MNAETFTLRKALINPNFRDREARVSRGQLTLVREDSVNDLGIATVKALSAQMIS